MRTLGSRTLPVVGVALAAAALALAAPASAQVDGAAVYDRWCAGCHGVDGTGDGPGAGTMWPRPRDFTQALYQIRTTATGELPTDDDMMHVIDVGMPGTAMPGWEDVLTLAERQALITHLKTFSAFFDGPAPEPLSFGRAPGVSDERLAEGRSVFETVQCADCHGEAGRGDGNSAPTLSDDNGFPIHPADLTQNWRFNGGGTVEDIYRRLRTGLDGTPMPSNSDLIDAGVITDDQLWSLAHYVRSLSPERAPAVREVIVAGMVEGDVPTTVDDPRWADTDRFWIPLAGQIVLKPRWFAPAVSGLWVRALHNDGEVALLVSWTDRSMSPDPEWAEFAGQVMATMVPADDGAATEAGAPDQLVVQFPQAPTEGMERPYFLQGDARRPAYLWTWDSGSQRAVESVARGFGTGQPQSAQSVTASAAWQDGQWNVLLRRTVASDDAEDLAFPIGQAVPVAFQAWDGDNGEQGTQGAVSTWYFLLLQQATPATVYVAPAVALVLTFAFGLMVVSRARKREDEVEGAVTGD